MVIPQNEDVFFLNWKKRQMIKVYTFTDEQGRKVVVVSTTQYIDGEKFHVFGRAICAKSDTFDLKKGIKIALDNANYFSIVYVHDIVRTTELLDYTAKMIVNMPITGDKLREMAEQKAKSHQLKEENAVKGEIALQEEINKIAERDAKRVEQLNVALESIVEEEKKSQEEYEQLKQLHEQTMAEIEEDVKLYFSNLIEMKTVISEQLKQLAA